MLAPVSYTAQANGSGAFSATLWGNDQISPSGTFYQLTIYAANGNFIQAASYQFTGNLSADLSTLTPISGSVTPSAGYSPIVANPNSTQSISGHPLNLLAGGTSVTPATNDNSTNIATTAFVKAQPTGINATQLQGNSVSSSSPSSNQVLTWNGSAWAPTNASSNATSIQGVSVSAAAPSTNQVLQYNGSAWVPATPSFSGNATSLQGNAISSTSPSSGQVLSYVSGQWTPTTAPSGSTTYNVRYTTDFSWSQTGNATNFPALTAGTLATVTLTPCPAGVDTSAAQSAGGPQGGYPVYISDGANSESVYVSGGTCTPRAASGTIAFTPFFSHTAAAYTIETASAGIQEAINDAGGNGIKIIVPSNGGTPYNIYDTIYFHANESLLSGYGAKLNCAGRGPCLQLGNLTNSNNYNAITVEGLSFLNVTSRAGNSAYTGNVIASASRTAGVTTITTVGNHNFRTGDRVTQMLHDIPAFWGDVPSITVTSPTQYQYSRPGSSDIALTTSPGVVALTYVALLDNVNSGRLVNLQYDYIGNVGGFNHFFDLWDDECCYIQGFTNNSIGLNQGANWTPSWLFSGGANCLPSTSHQLAPVITLRDSSLTCNGSNGVTVYNCNGLYIIDTVIQAQGPWCVYVSNETGNFQGVHIQGLYSEDWPNSNPVVNPLSPWGGCGSAGLIIGGLSAAGNATILGVGASLPGGYFASDGSGSTQFNYWVIGKDSNGSVTDAMLCHTHTENSPSTPTVLWPRMRSQGTVTYDLLRTSGTVYNSGATSTPPYSGACPGGSVAACGSVATGLTQTTGFVNSFVDNTANATTAYSFSGSTATTLACHFWGGGNVALLNGTGQIPIYSDAEVLVQTNYGDGTTALIARMCAGINQGNFTVICLGSKQTPNNAIEFQNALLLTDGPQSGGESFSGTKGRLNFFRNAGTSMSNQHLITLVDSNAAKTIHTPANRPASDVGDCYIGVDALGGGAALNNAPLAIGSPLSISQYISNTGDGTNWLERLTSGKKQFAVPVQLASYTFATLPAGMSNGTAVFCSDCTAGTTCSGSGSGSLAVHVNGSWKCL